ncbi:MAG: hypothetical protein QGD92_11100 [Gammaproteobacteria bacterium]|nr:hypothetical protein [Gammaproteobacteria bacterium]
MTGQLQRRRLIASVFRILCLLVTWLVISIPGILIYQIAVDG